MEEELKIALITNDSDTELYLTQVLGLTQINTQLTVAENSPIGICSITNDFDCILLDIALSPMPLDLVKKLQQFCKPAPIVIIITEGDEKIAADIIKAGALDYLINNSISPIELGQILQRAKHLGNADKKRIFAEAALKHSEKRYRTFFEKTQGFSCTHTLEGIFISVNYAGARSIDYTPDELIGTPLIDIVSPSFKSLIPSYLTKICREKAVKGYMRVMNKNGEERIWRYHNYLYDGDGEPYIIGSAQDITDRIKMEQEIRKAKRTAEESEKIKEQFLANMSHEIRTPMNAIIGFTNLLLNSRLTNEQKDYLDTIHFAGQHLLVIIDDILDISKISAGKLILEQIEFSLSGLIDSLTNLFRLKTAEKNIKLHSHIHTDVPSLIKGDPVRLNQVLTNLLNNAVKFTAKGSIDLHVKLNTSNNGKRVLEFSVEDTGIGIPTDKLETVFESFSQANTDTNRKYGGTGLGLTIVKNIIELHGGHIKAENREGGGTKFIFTLPFIPARAIAQDKLPTPAKKRQQAKTHLKGIKVLLVEDNKINQKLASIMLKKMECEITLADNGLVGIEKLKHASFDIILMDIQMPEMDGLETTRYIRTRFDAQVKAIPIIAITAHAFNEERIKCLEAGMNEYLSKPFEPSVLYEKMIALIHGQNDQGYQENPSQNTHSVVEVDWIYVKTFIGEDEHDLSEMIDLLCVHIPKMIHEIQIQGANANWKQLKQAVHKIKPNIALLRIIPFKQVLDTLEKYAEEETNLDLIPALINQVVSFAEALIETIKKEQERILTNLV